MFDDDEKREEELFNYIRGRIDPFIDEGSPFFVYLYNLDIWRINRCLDIWSIVVHIQN